MALAAFAEARSLFTTGSWVSIMCVTTGSDIRREFRTERGPLLTCTRPPRREPPMTDRRLECRLRYAIAMGFCPPARVPRNQASRPTESSETPLDAQRARLSDPWEPRAVVRYESSADGGASRTSSRSATRRRFGLGGDPAKPERRDGLCFVFTISGVANGGICRKTSTSA